MKNSILIHEKECSHLSGGKSFIVGKEIFWMVTMILKNNSTSSGGVNYSSDEENISKY